MEESPIDDYGQMTVGDVESAVSPYTNGLEQLSDSDLVERLDLVTAVLEYEQATKDRKTAKTSIGDVRDALRAEARPRGLLTKDEEAEEARTSDDDDDSGERDTASDADDAPADSSEDETEAPSAPVDDDAGPMEANEQDAAEAAFTGNDQRQRIVVKNHLKESRRVAGHGFDGGEVKELVVDAQLKSAIRRGHLQVVKG